MLPDAPAPEYHPARRRSSRRSASYPTRSSSAGCRLVRWWEFEDARIDLGDLKPSTTDLASLLLAEFGLVFGNDWSLCPTCFRSAL